MISADGVRLTLTFAPPSYVVPYKFPSVPWTSAALGPAPSAPLSPRI
jgi:hypothetical protein